MSQSHIYTFGWARKDSSDGTSKAVTVTGEYERNAPAVAVAHGGAPVEVDVAFTRAGLQGLEILVNGTVGATLKTNSSGAPQDTIALAAGVPFTVVPACGITAAMVFGGDVTKLFFVNADGAIDVTVDVRCITNA